MITARHAATASPAAALSPAAAAAGAGQPAALDRLPGAGSVQPSFAVILQRQAAAATSPLTADASLAGAASANPFATPTTLAAPAVRAASASPGRTLATADAARTAAARASSPRAGAPAQPDAADAPRSPSSPSGPARSAQGSAGEAARATERRQIQARDQARDQARQQAQAQDASAAGTEQPATGATAGDTAAQATDRTAARAEARTEATWPERVAPPLAEWLAAWTPGGEAAAAALPGLPEQATAALDTAADAARLQLGERPASSDGGAAPSALGGLAGQLGTAGDARMDLSGGGPSHGGGADDRGDGSDLIAGMDAGASLEGAAGASASGSAGFAQALSSAFGGAGAAPALPPASASVAEPVGSPAFPAALGEEVRVLVQRAADGAGASVVQEARLELNPADMGAITVRIAVEGDQAQVHFEAASAATRRALEASLPALADALASSGLQLAGGGVSEQRQPSGGQGGAPAPAGAALRQPPGRADGVEAAVAPEAAPRWSSGRGGLDVYA